jgi:hypothetical protein
MTTAKDVKEVLRELEVILKRRAMVEKGYKPGTKPYLSYVYGTLQAERERLRKAVQKRKPLTRESARRD